MPSTCSHSERLLNCYRAIRNTTDQIVEPLSPEDCMVQSMDDVSPTRWHLAHTTWFFETFILKDRSGYQVFDPQFNFLFNSYYNTIGEQFPRPQRGFISRPGLDEMRNYRQYVDQHMHELLQSEEVDESLARVIDVGLNHEQQHQELILTDIKHVLACNPTFPIYQDLAMDNVQDSVADHWISIDDGVYSIGYEGPNFSFDNESPVHSTFLQPCEVSSRLVRCGEFLEFIEDGGYEKPEYWLSLGWSAVQQNRWNAPMYWLQQDNQWKTFTLAGLQAIHPDWPICHVSYFEADAFARWAGMRLPTELEWEVAERICSEDNDASMLDEQPFVDVLLANQRAIHPTRSPKGFMGSVWQWTSSSYTAYPGYRAPEGAIGEYNGKFMCNQYVLRGGSVATSSSHIRPTYRNFFPADTRWQFAGLRLAR